MIIGIFLGVSLSVFLTSTIFILSNYSGVLRENLMTGAAIGANQLISYAFITLIISLVSVVSLVLVLKRRFSD